MNRVIYSLELELDAGHGPQSTVLDWPYFLQIFAVILLTASGPWKVLNVNTWRDGYIPPTLFSERQLLAIPDVRANKCPPKGGQEQVCNDLWSRVGLWTVGVDPRGDLSAADI